MKRVVFGMDESCIVLSSSKDILMFANECQVCQGQEENPLENSCNFQHFLQEYEYGNFEAASE